MNYDKYKNCIWLFSPNAIYKLSIEKEDRHIWKAYLEKGNFESALKQSEKTDLSIFKNISKLYGDYLYSQKLFEESIKHYSLSNENFEIVVLKFLMENQYIPLSSNYL